MDEREGFITASKLKSGAECNGQFKAEEGIPEPPSSEVAARGTLIHSALFGETVQLPDEDVEIYYQLLRKRRAVVETHFPEGVEEEIREQRIYMAGDPRLKGNRFSGMPDYVCRTGGKFMVVDYKTGRGHVEDSADNLQLRALAVLVAEEYKEADVILVAIVQAFATPQVVAYTKNDLNDAREEVLNIIEAATNPDAARTPNEVSCKYCKARPTCPEATGTVSEIGMVSPSDLSNPANLPRLLDACDVATKVIADIKERAAGALARGEKIEGWELRNGNKTRRIDNQTGFRKALIADKLLTPSDLSTLKITEAEVARLLAKKNGVPLSQARELLAEKFSKYINESQGAKRLTRK